MERCCVIHPKFIVVQGIAFVQFTDRDAVALAVELNDSKIGYRNIRVNRLKKQVGACFLRSIE